MKIKENVLLFVLAGLVFFIAYLLLAGLPLDEEIQFVPRWTVDIQEEFASLINEKETADLSFDSIPENSVPFKLGQLLGFVTPDGTIPYILSFPDKAALSQSYWTSYSSNSAEIDVHNAKDGTSFIIKDSGFPHFVDNSFFVFYPGGNSFGKYSTDGSKLWAAEHWSPITAFASNEAGTVCGYADGELRFLTANGQLDFSMYPGGSSHEVILGAGISHDGAYIAAVCGLDKQRFVLIQMNGKNSKIVYHTYLDSQKRGQTYVHFNEAGSRVYFNYDGGLGIVDCEKYILEKIPVNGNVCAISELEQENLNFVLVQNEQKWTVIGIESFSNVIGSFSFTAAHAFMSTVGNDLFIGKDSKISKMEIVRK